MATWLTGVERTATTVVSITDDDPNRLFRTFINTVLLTRDIAE
jgi:D-amino peptidase